jgi:hypothetical protein
LHLGESGASRRWAERALEDGEYLVKGEMSGALRLLRGNCPKGRKRPGWKRDIFKNIQAGASDLDDGISEAQILKTIRRYRPERKKLPEIGVSFPREKTIEKCE